MNIQELITSRFKMLPPPIQERLTSPETQWLMQDIGKRYGLHIDELGAVEREFILVLLGLTIPEQFVNNLTKHTRLSSGDAEAITRELNQKIFAPLQEDFRTLYKRDVETREQELARADPTSLDPVQVGGVDAALPESVYSGAGGIGRSQTSSSVPAPSPQETLAAKATVEAKRLEGASHLSPAARDITSLAPPQEEPSAAPKPYKADPYREPIT